MRHGEMGRHGDTAGHGHGNLLVLLVASVVGSTEGSSSVRAVPMIQYAGVSLEGMPWLGGTLSFKRLRFQTYNLNLNRRRAGSELRDGSRRTGRASHTRHARAHAVNTEPTYVISLHPPGRRITANPPGARRRRSAAARTAPGTCARTTAPCGPGDPVGRILTGLRLADTDTR